jgi:hypothetical protein
VSTLRLRPAVRATATTSGLHLRGWDSSVTIDGGTGVHALWRWLDGHLTAGVDRDALLTELPPPSARPAVRLLVDQLEDLGMVYAGEEAPDWLAAFADAPADAGRRLSAATALVTGGPLGAAVAAALVRCGVRAEHVPGAGPVVAASGDHTVVIDGAAPIVVSPVTEPDTARAVAAHARSALGATFAPTPAARELAAWIAADRLVRALAGMAADPAVAVVRTDPLGVTRHTRPDSTPPAADTRAADTRAADTRAADTRAADTRAADTRAADTLDAALLAADVLADPVFGLLRPVRVDTHPQLPVGLAEVDGPRAPITAAGTTTDTARLAVVTAAAQQLLGPAREAAVGFTASHALGLLLRHRVHADPALGTPRDTDWRTDPQAARWTRTTGHRLGLDVTVRTRDLGGAWHAVAVDPSGDVLGWAVELAAGSAAALALVAAAGRHIAGTPVIGPSGALPPPDITTDDLRGDLGAWLWPAPLAEGESQLHEVLGRLAGGRHGTAPSAAAADLTRAGLTVLTGPGSPC